MSTRQRDGACLPPPGHAHSEGHGPRGVLSSLKSWPAFRCGFLGNDTGVKRTRARDDVTILPSAVDAIVPSSSWQCASAKNIRMRTKRMVPYGP